MIATPHALAGAVACVKAPSMAAGVAAAIQSHFALDRLPHEDYSIAGRQGLLRVALDISLAAGLLHVSGARGARPWIGALAGIAPDVLGVLARRNTHVRELPGVEHVLHVHDDNHTDNKVDPLFGWVIQLAAAAVFFGLLKRLSS